MTYLTLLFINRTVCGACAIVGAFLVHAKGIPSGRTEDVFFIYVVHAYRNTKHRGQCNQVGTDMSVADGTVVGSPVVHNGIYIAECRFVAQARNKPSRRPSGVGALVQHFKDFRVYIGGPTFGNLQYGASFDKKLLEKPPPRK